VQRLTKQGLRKKVLDLIKHQKEEDALRKSRIISDKFLALPVFKKAKNVLFYASCKGEVDTIFLINRALSLGKCVALPKVLKDTKRIMAVSIRSTDELKPGAYGIPEPEDRGSNLLGPEELDLVVVPGLAFDLSCRRLGRGQGYYDRFFSELPHATPCVGLAYDFQMVKEIPDCEEHDRPVTQVLHN
jgi:5-formyltetrahydrofolate cyclo-ligase